MNRIGFGANSFALNSLGLGLSTPVVSGPKLQADFTTGTYKASGAAKTFADLFTFTRAGKAWLVKDTGLQEYATDVPRLDGGLLIEQSATNLMFYSSLPNFSAINRYNTVFEDGLWKKETAGLTARLNPTTVNSLKKNHVISMESVGEFSTGYISSQIVQLTKAGRVSFGVVDTALDGRLSGVIWKADEDTQKPKYVQLEAGIKPTSLIVTDTTPVTRPADFLISKITGTTVTGDWDSTLTLSIVSGKLVHSGYGRIRSLEIN